MSYCRMGKNSDVHIIESSMGLICVACKLTQQPNKDVENLTIMSHEGMLQHIIIHRATGHKVPMTAVRQIQAEINANNQTQKTWSTDFSKCPKRIDVLVRGEILQEHSRGNWKESQTATVVGMLFKGNEFTLTHNYYYLTEIRASHWMHLPVVPPEPVKKAKGNK